MRIDEKGKGEERLKFREENNQEYTDKMRETTERIGKGGKELQKRWENLMRYIWKTLRELKLFEGKQKVRE